jgi:preprotein translocase subunit YajC
MTRLLLLAQQQPADAWVSWMPIIAIVFLGYFMLFRPMRRQQQEMRAMLASLKRNDEVIAAGGIIGTVVNIREKAVGNEDEITLKIDDKTRIRVLRSSIMRILKGDEAGATQKETGSG